MPGIKCAVANCTNSYNKTKLLKGKEFVSYHHFPQDRRIRKKWVSTCQRDDTFDPKTSYICSNHFDDDGFERNNKAEILGFLATRMLRKTAVPTLNLKNDIPKQANFFHEIQNKKTEENSTVHSESHSPLASINQPALSNMRYKELYENLLVKNEQISKKFEMYRINMEEKIDALEAVISKLQN